MPSYLESLESRLHAESAAYASASQNAKPLMAPRLQRLRQLLAEEKARRAQYLPPQSCLCLK